MSKYCYCIYHEGRQQFIQSMKGPNWTNAVRDAMMHTKTGIEPIFHQCLDMYCDDEIRLVKVMTSSEAKEAFRDGT